MSLHTVSIINVLLGIVGLSIAFYIYHKKRRSAPLVCPIGSDCDSVVHSDYAEFFGIPLEKIGLLYYFLIVAFYATAFFVPALNEGMIHFIMLGVTLGSFLFSLYLISIQAFVLHEWCTWCLGSATVSSLIFVANFFVADLEIMPFLVAYKVPILLLHGIGAAVGLGAAVVTDFLFFKFLQDGKVSIFEDDVMRTLSRIIWFALGIMVLSGIGLFLPRAEELAESSKFLVKMIALGVIILNGVALNLVITPQLTKIDFSKDIHLLPPQTRRMRKLAFALGAVSITSWFTVFILGSMRSVTLSFGDLLILYVGVVALAICLSQVTVGHVRTKSE